MPVSPGGNLPNDFRFSPHTTAVGVSKNRAMQRPAHRHGTTQGELMVDVAAELRADFARRKVPYYVAAPHVGLHPTLLGRYLSGQRPLYPERIDVCVAETVDGLCLRWISRSEPLDAAIWGCFASDVLAEARNRLVARAGSESQSSSPTDPIAPDRGACDLELRERSRV